MHNTIHPTAVINAGARLADDISVGPYTIIGDDVEIASGTVVGPHVVIDSHTRIGEGCRIFNGASIGTIPQDKKYNGELTYLQIGNNTVIREFCTINRGTAAAGKTVIGSNGWIMAYCHIAHDCIIGDNVTISNNLAMAGHVEIGDFVSIGGIVPIHQFTRIGSYAFIGAAAKPFKDVLPFALCAGDPGRIIGINKIGLERNGFDETRRTRIKRAFRILFRNHASLDEGIKELETKFPADVDVCLIIDFIKKSKRGLMRM